MSIFFSIVSYIFHNFKNDLHQKFYSRFYLLSSFLKKNIYIYKNIEITPRTYLEEKEKKREEKKRRGRRKKEKAHSWKKTYSWVLIFKSGLDFTAREPRGRLIDPRIEGIYSLRGLARERPPSYKLLIIRNRAACKDRVGAFRGWTGFRPEW